MRYACPCCGFLTYKEKPGDTYYICPVCVWEDDGWQFLNPESGQRANKVSLLDAKKNFKNYGACEERFVKYVREPLEEEKKR